MRVDAQPGIDEGRDSRSDQRRRQQPALHSNASRQRERSDRHERQVDELRQGNCGAGDAHRYGARACPPFLGGDSEAHRREQKSSAVDQRILAEGRGSGSDRRRDCDGQHDPPAKRDQLQGPEDETNAQQQVEQTPQSERPFDREIGSLSKLNGENLRQISDGGVNDGPEEIVIDRIPVAADRRVPAEDLGNRPADDLRLGHGHNGPDLAEGSLAESRREFAPRLRTAPLAGELQRTDLPRPIQMLIFVETLERWSQERIGRIEKRSDQQEKAVRASLVARGRHLIRDRFKGGHPSCRTNCRRRTIVGTLRMSKFNAERISCKPLRIGRAAIMTCPAVAACP
jgi:hypothetical protein